MKLLIWCKEPKAKILTGLAPVIQGYRDVDIHIVNDVTVPPKAEDLKGATVILALGNDPKDLMASTGFPVSA